MAEAMESLHSELYEAAGAGRRLGERIASVAGQTQSRWQVLWTARHAAPATVPQIARRLGVTRQNVQRVTADLAADGLVRLAANPDHRTSPLVVLTAAGDDALDRINAAAEESHRRILASVPPRDVEALRTLLRRFTAATRALDEDPTSPPADPSATPATTNHH